MVNFRPAALSLVLLPFGTNGNPSGCVTDQSLAANFQFDHQVEAVDSSHWSIMYEDNFKILTNIAAGETYLLYQCGTVPPSDEMINGGHTTILPVPLLSVGLQYTTMIPFLELLGARMKIGAFFGEGSWVTSPCVTELLDAVPSSIETVPDTSNATLITNVPLELPSFIGHFADLPFTHSARVSLTEEDTNLAVFEWIKFYSAFFNLEEHANQIYEDTKQRYECSKENANILSCEVETKPTVLWGSYSAYCGGWSVAQCPNYYCELAEACSATMLHSDEGSIYSELCGATYMNTTEFVAFAKDADYWIYTSSDFENTLSTFPELMDFVSVQNQEVYDNQGRVGWFEQRLAEPDVLLQDFCDIVGFENPANIHPRAWFRNVYTEATGSIGECSDPNAPMTTPHTECVVVSSDACQEEGAMPISVDDNNNVPPSVDSGDSVDEAISVDDGTSAPVVVIEGAGESSATTTNLLLLAVVAFAVSVALIC